MCSGRRWPVDAVEIELRVFQRSEVFFLCKGGLPVRALDGDGRAGPAQHVQRADFFDGEVVQPELAFLAAPDTGVEFDGVEVEAVDEHAELLPVARAAAG